MNSDIDSVWSELRQPTLYLAGVMFVVCAYALAAYNIWHHPSWIMVPFGFVGLIGLMFLLRDKAQPLTELGSKWVRFFVLIHAAVFVFASLILPVAFFHGVWVSGDTTTVDAPFVVVFPWETATYFPFEDFGKQCTLESLDGLKLVVEIHATNGHLLTDGQVLVKAAAEGAGVSAESAFEHAASRICGLQLQ